MKIPENTPISVDEDVARRSVFRRRAFVMALAAWSAVGPAAAQRLATLEAIKGTWVRPDGGYIIFIRDVAPDGALDATYFNPNELPFAKAQASREGAAVRLAFELRAGGYNGSTYALSYDAATDRLTGTYYQAVAKQTFAVFFARR